MMKIAVYQRHTGATREENQSALEEWYARQPEELIGSTPEEVQRDISGILDWVYSDRFTAARRMVRDSTAVSETKIIPENRLSSACSHKVRATAHIRGGHRQSHRDQRQDGL